ncbi:hypothetical protein LZ198_08945 [Myxococcus sp. K15C18031901]|uniref:hypothetical protein n=1 Tax=Myxococcus dinghuensis TaxID=2906761 RepID=UPI0020A745A7|nr:hypothetical protein [Myxococcus dinghuensis]MCP3099003.1 hypothetical protein [Myxococcus dinghuensis]
MVEKFSLGEPMDPGSTSSAGTKARDDAEAALKGRIVDSVGSAFKVSASALPFLAIVLTGLIALHQLTASILIAMLLALISAWFGGFFFFELKRLSECRRALESVLKTEKNYEDLLRDTRTERDQAVNERIAIETKSIFQAEAAKLVAVVQEQMAQPPQSPVKTKRRSLKGVDRNVVSDSDP